MPIHASGRPSSTIGRHASSRPATKWGITAVARQEPEAVDAAARRPDAVAEGHGTRARAGEAGAAVEGVGDRRPGRRVAEDRGHQVRVAARDVDQVRAAEQADERRIGRVGAG